MEIREREWDRSPTSTHCSVDCSHVGAWYLHDWAATLPCLPIFLSLAKHWASSDGAPRGSTDKQPGCHISALRSSWSLQPLHSSSVPSFNLYSRGKVVCALPSFCHISSALYVPAHICPSLSICGWYWFSFSIIHPYFARSNVSIHQVLESILSSVWNPHHSSGKLCLWW